MTVVQITLEAVDVQLAAQQALTNVSLRIFAGECVALVGSNGSGKSTLLRTLHGLVPHSQGQLRHAPGLQLAMLFQRPYLLRMSALNNVALGLWLGHVSAQQRNIPLDQLKSGLEFSSPEVRGLQLDDDFASPSAHAIDKGAQLWKQVTGSNNKS